MERIEEAIREFGAQPWGLAGAACIMAAVTLFNSRRLQQVFTPLRLSREGMAFVLNALNLAGGASLLVNAVIRDEVVWIVLEVYFVLIALKGAWQNRDALRVLSRG